MNKRKLKKYAKKKGLPMPLKPGSKFFKEAGKFPAVKKLTGGQAKLDKNKNNKIDAEDFKLLRKEKKGRPMKAKRGMSTDDFIKRRKELMGIRSVGPAAGMMGTRVASQAEVKKGTKKLGKGRLGAITAIGAAGIGLAQKKLKERMGKKKAEKRDAAKVKKMGGGMMKRYSKGGGADTGTAGERRSKLAVTIDKINKATTRLKNTGKAQAVKNFVNRVKADVRDSGKTKMMGGGMMQRPMGYKAGTMIKARGGGMARSKPTKMY